jgi:hypothetical protein
MLWEFKGCGYVIGISGVWLCYGYLRGVVMLWVFKGVVMLWIFKVCGYAMGI